MMDMAGLNVEDHEGMYAQKLSRETKIVICTILHHQTEASQSQHPILKCTG